MGEDVQGSQPKDTPVDEGDLLMHARTQVDIRPEPAKLVNGMLNLFLGGTSELR
jgi:hypothetical protein